MLFGAHARRPSTLSAGLLRGGRRQITTWHAAVAKVPVTKILPLGFGGVDDVKAPAWLGDKLLSSAIAAAIWRQSEERSSVKLTRWHHKASSNGFFHTHLAAIVPSHVDLFSAVGNHNVHHGAGTMVEAAVAAVHADEGGAAAVHDLAEWLVATAADSPTIFNATGRLYELGGSVTVEVIGGPAHAPQFRAVATLGETTLMATCTGSKNQAKQLVSERLINAVFDAADY